MDSTNGSNPESQIIPELTDAEVESRMLSPELIAKGLEGANRELAVQILADFQRLSQAAALRDQTLADDLSTRLELEAIKTARLWLNTLATIEPEQAVAWMAMRMRTLADAASAVSQRAAVQTVGRMLDTFTKDDAHLDALTDQLLKELDAQHPENGSARRTLVRRALDVARKREEIKPEGQGSGGNYL